YRVPEFLVPKTELDIDISKQGARVTAKLAIRRNPESKNRKAPLFLNGENQKLLSVKLNDRALAAKNYKLDAHGLTIAGVPDKFSLEIVTTHDPAKNTAVSGLYVSGPMLVTQCEAEGFRRITYYPDRPDVMSSFRVMLHADRKKYPVLLANGNLLKSGAEAG